MNNKQVNKMIKDNLNDCLEISRRTGKDLDFIINILHNAINANNKNNIGEA